MQQTRDSIFFCFCGPAASGKSTISREVLTKVPNLQLSISTTTRALRGSEVDGKEYYFVSDAEFVSRIAADRFIEHAEYSGKRYGTEKVNVEKAQASGCDLILDIEVQGVKQMKQLYPAQVVTIFVFPPSMQVLESRLRSRGTEDEAKIQARLKIAAEELRVLRSPGFSDYLIVNDDLPASIETAVHILAAESKRFLRYRPSFIKALG